MDVDNNPFQPTLKEPVDDSILANDSTKNDSADSDFRKFSDIQPPVNPHAFSADEVGSTDAADIQKPVISSMEQQPVNETPAAMPTVDTKPNKQAIKEAKKLAKQAAKNARKQPRDPNAPKRIVITWPTIILILLVIGLAISTFLLWRANNTADSKLTTANARVVQLKAEIGDTSDANGVNTSQFSSLQDKIAQLTKQQTTDQNTINTQKSQISDLTTKLATAQQQATNITTLANNVSGLIGNCNVVSGSFGQTAATACTATIVSANGNTPAGINISQKQ